MDVIDAEVAVAVAVAILQHNRADKPDTLPTSQDPDREIGLSFVEHGLRKNEQIDVITEANLDLELELRRDVQQLPGLTRFELACCG
ncbi:MAG: hypothetical protein WAU69_01750 [Solirubrobacteraceae bacterium]